MNRSRWRARTFSSLEPHCACGGSCPRCQASSSLQIGEPDDRYEREADAVADQVMRREDSQARVESSAGAAPGEGGSAPPSVDQALDSPGQPLAPETRAFFEPRFGHDFSGVQVHSGAAAAKSAQEVNARAYTVGHDIVFGTGRSRRERTKAKGCPWATVTQQSGTIKTKRLQRAIHIRLASSTLFEDVRTT